MYLGQVESTPWWQGPVTQVFQAGADWISQEATGVPTYGGAQVYPYPTSDGAHVYVPAEEAPMQRQPMTVAGIPLLPLLGYGAVAWFLLRG